MTLIYELNLDILKMYLHKTEKTFWSRLSKDRALQTDMTENITMRHLQLVKINVFFIFKKICDCQKFKKIQKITFINECHNA